MMNKEFYKKIMKPSKRLDDTTKKDSFLPDTFFDSRTPHNMRVVSKIKNINRSIVGNLKSQRKQQMMPQTKSIRDDAIK